MTETTDPTEATVEFKRARLTKLLENARNIAWEATVNAEAGRASAAAVKQSDEVASLRKEAESNDRKALAFRAAARRYAELLADLPTEAPADADTPTETNDPGA